MTRDPASGTLVAAFHVTPAELYQPMYWALYTSVDRGRSWTPFHETLSSIRAGLWLSGLEIRNRTLYAATALGVFATRLEPQTRTRAVRR